MHIDLVPLSLGTLRLAHELSESLLDLELVAKPGRQRLVVSELGNTGVSVLALMASVSQEIRESPGGSATKNYLRQYEAEMQKLRRLLRAAMSAGIPGGALALPESRVKELHVLVTAMEMAVWPMAARRAA